MCFGFMLSGWLIYVDTEECFQKPNQNKYIYYK